MLVDSHCHLDKLNYADLHPDVATVVNNAKAAGVDYLLSVSVTLAHFPAMLELTRPFSNVFASCGVHPMDIGEGVDMALLSKLAEDEKVVAIGETGLDYYYQTDDIALQQTAFRQHIQLAIKLQKPLIIHTRMAKEDTLTILKEEGAERVGGVLHCFTEDLDMAMAAIELGFYISISGIVSFKKATELHEVVRHLPLDKLLVETDSPYLAPVPYRGKENQPAYTREVAQAIALLKGLPVETIAAATTENFFRLFKKAKM